MTREQIEQLVGDMEKMNKAENMPNKQISDWWYMGPEHGDISNLCCTININNITYILLPNQADVMLEYLEETYEEYGDLLLIPIDNRNIIIRKRKCSHRVTNINYLEKLNSITTHIIDSVNPDELELESGYFRIKAICK